MHLQFDIQLQCIQISTRINSSNVHTYIFSLFYIACIQLQSNIQRDVRSIIQHGVRIEAVATSLQQGESTDRIQQFPAYFSKHPEHPEHFYSRITILLFQEREEDSKQCKVPLCPGSSEQFYPAESSF